MTNAVERFVAAVRESSELQAAVRSLEDPPSLVSHARTLGYEFSVDDLGAWVARQSSAELSDKELEKLSGGGDWSTWNLLKSRLFGVDPSFY